MHPYPTIVIVGDPTDHGSNVGAVALFALAIFALIGLLVFVITRRGRRPLHPPRPMPGPRRDAEGEQRQGSSTSDARAK